jgi:hypothetical protein
MPLRRVHWCQSAQPKPENVTSTQCPLAAGLRPTDANQITKEMPYFLRPRWRPGGVTKIAPGWSGGKPNGIATAQRHSPGEARGSCGIQCGAMCLVDSGLKSAHAGETSRATSRRQASTMVGDGRNLHLLHNIGRLVGPNAFAS